MQGSPVRLLRSAPATVPALAAVGVLVWWSADQAGYPVATWAPGTLAVLVLLGAAAAIVPNRWGDIPVAVRVATVAFAAFTAWSYLTIFWADDQGAAWEGANRGLLYLALFALFALWRQRRETAALLVGGWALALIVLALITVVRIAAAGDPGTFFVADRLSAPAGYPNAAAAVWLMALWPALTLSAARAVPWLLRGVFAGGAVVLVDLALMAQSRGSLFAMPLVIAAFFALVPGRVRHAAAFALIAAGVAATARTALHATTSTGPVPDRVDHLAVVLLGTALAVGAVVAVAALVATRRPPSEELARRAQRAGAALCAGAVVIGLTAGLVAAGNPIHRLQDGWDSFKGGYAENSQGSRLISGLGSNRYDFYRVGLNRFTDAPLAGIGADNFQQDYLVHGRSSETPRYPHSLEVRTLLQTGLIGALLLGTALGAALLAAWRGMRSSGPLGLAVAGGAAGTFVYWAAHGSVDWFWEFAGLGGPAFALLGAACALAPRPQPGRSPAVALGRDGLLAGGLAALVTAAAVAVALPWLAQRDVDDAGKIFDVRPQAAYAKLDRAEELDPLSDRAALVKGSIALRFADLERADRAFAEALRRNPRGAYATLERGAIASARGDRQSALALLRRAVALTPRDPLARQALTIVREGDTLDVDNLARAILLRARELNKG